MWVQVQLRPNQQDGIEQQAEPRAEAADGGVRPGGGAAAAAAARQWGREGGDHALTGEWPLGASRRPCGSCRAHASPLGGPLLGPRAHRALPLRIADPAECNWDRRSADARPIIRRRRRSRPARCLPACRRSDAAACLTSDVDQINHQKADQTSVDKSSPCERDSEAAPARASAAPPRALRRLEQQQQRLHRADLPSLHVAHNLQRVGRNGRQRGGAGTRRCRRGDGAGGECRGPLRGLDGAPAPARRPTRPPSRAHSPCPCPHPQVPHPPGPAPRSAYTWCCPRCPRTAARAGAGSTPAATPPSTAAAAAALAAAPAAPAAGPPPPPGARRRRRRRDCRRCCSGRPRARAAAAHAGCAAGWKAPAGRAPGAPGCACTAPALRCGREDGGEAGMGTGRTSTARQLAPLVPLPPCLWVLCGAGGRTRAGRHERVTAARRARAPARSAQSSHPCAGSPGSQPAAPCTAPLAARLCRRWAPCQRPPKPCSAPRNDTVGSANSACSS